MTTSQYKAKDNKSANIKSFLGNLQKCPITERTFMTVGKLKIMLSKISKTKKKEAAMRVKQLKRYAMYFEESVRLKIACTEKDRSKGRGTFEKEGFFEILDEKEIIDIVSVYKKLSPDDFDSPLFDSIVKHWGAKNLNYDKLYESSDMKKKQLTAKNEMTDSQLMEFDEEEKVVEEPTQPDEDIYNAIFNKEKMLKNKRKQQKNSLNFEKLHLWKNNSEENWKFLANCFNSENMLNIKLDTFLVDLNLQEGRQCFEELLTLILTEIYKLFQNFLKSTNLSGRNFKKMATPLKIFFLKVYKSIMHPLSYAEGEVAYYYKIYLHIIYEIEAYLETIGTIVNENSSDIMD